jgi:hypothetical protein
VFRAGVYAFVAATVVFCVVQDRVTAAGVRQYVALQRVAIAQRAPAVRLDDVMRPARQRSVELGLLWGGVTGAAALGGVAILRRARRG